MKVILFIRVSRLSSFDFNFDDNYLLNLCKVVGANEAENLYLDLEVSEEFAEFPSEMASTLNFTNINLVWNSTLKSTFQMVISDLEIF